MTRLCTAPLGRGIRAREEVAGSVRWLPHPLPRRSVDLESGSPLWPALDPAPPASPALEKPERCEVAVVGAGVSGALLAWRLASEGADVVVLDRRRPGAGSTAANTALLEYTLDLTMSELAGRIGEERAVRVYRSCRDAVATLEEWTRELGDSCGFRRRPSAYLASSEGDATGIRDEAALRERHGFPVELWERNAIEERFPFSRSAALLTPDAGEVDPLRLTRALLAAAVEQGARVYSHTEVTGYAAGRRSVALRTTRGHRVRTNRVAAATGYETEECLPDPRVSLWSTYALASEPVESFPGWWERCLLWETARPAYLYLRTTGDGRILVGGEDEPYTDAAARDAALPEKTRRLAERFAELFPNTPLEVAHAWTGTFAETEDSLPFIGPRPGLPRACFSLGYGGNGTLFAVIAAEVLADLHFGRANADAELFGFGR